jgi:hypothetical protein
LTVPEKYLQQYPMEKQRPPVLAAYDLVIAKVKEMHEAKTGRPHGAVSWLAKKLGKSRQTLDNWADRAGFPPNVVDKVAKITGLPPETILPDTVNILMPTEDYTHLATNHPESFKRSIITKPRRRNGQDQR